MRAGRTGRGRGRRHPGQPLLTTRRGSEFQVGRAGSIGDTANASKCKKEKRPRGDRREVAESTVPKPCQSQNTRQGGCASTRSSSQSWRLAV
ncbi:hypothetical protein VULLAG_LOCUS13669 [Vulpes lagopus]